MAAVGSERRETALGYRLCSGMLDDIKYSSCLSCLDLPGGNHDNALMNQHSCCPCPHFVLVAERSGGHGMVVIKAKNSTADEGVKRRQRNGELAMSSRYDMTD